MLVGDKSYGKEVKQSKLIEIKEIPCGMPTFSQSYIKRLAVNKSYG